MKIPQTTPQTKALFFSGIVVVASIGYCAWRGHQSVIAGERIEYLQSEADRLGGVLQKQVGDIWELNAELKTKEVALDSLRSKVAALPKPVPPVPLPTAPEEQIRFFQGFHLEPVVVAGGPGGLAFPPKDLPLIGQALQDSLNLPRVQEQLRGTELLVKELDGLGTLKDERIAKGDAALSTSREQTKAVQDQVQEYAKKLSSEQKKSRTTKFLYGIAGIGIGFLVRR